MSVLGSPSPNNRGSDNDVASQKRKVERKQILQRLIASQIPNRDENKTGETIMMMPLGRRNLLSPSEQNNITTNMQKGEIRMCSQLSLDPKADKKVARRRINQVFEKSKTIFFF